MSTIDEQKTVYPKLLEAIAIITFLSSTILFVLGHLSAYWYFSSFDIPYFKYTDTNTAFDFALKSIDVILSVIAFFLIIPVFIFIAKDFKVQSLEKERSRMRRVAFTFRVFATFMLLIVLLFFVIQFLGNIVISHDLKDRIKEKTYIPFEVSYKDGESLKCVTTIGTIGNYQVFLTQSLQKILIKKDSIISVKQMFSPYPLKVLPNGQRDMENPYFKEEMLIWLKKWANECPSLKEDTFEIFDFSTSGRHVVQR